MLRNHDVTGRFLVLVFAAFFEFPGRKFNRCFEHLFAFLVDLEQPKKIIYFYGHIQATDLDRDVNGMENNAYDGETEIKAWILEANNNRESLCTKQDNSV